MTLQDFALNLSVEQINILHEDLTNAAILFTTKKKKQYRAIFARGREQSSGNLKKIYSALYQADKQTIKNMIDAMLFMFNEQRNLMNNEGVKNGNRSKIN